MKLLLGYKVFKRKEWWTATLLSMAEHLSISYDSLKATEVLEFFYLYKAYEMKVNPKHNER